MIGRGASLASSALLAAVATGGLVLLAACATPPRRGATPGRRRPPPGRVVERLEDVGRGPAVLDVEVAFPRTDLPGAPLEPARSGRLLVAAGRARLLVEPDEERGGLDLVAAGAPSEEAATWLDGLARALAPLSLGPDRASGASDAGSRVEIFGGGVLRAVVHTGSGLREPEEVDVCDAAGRPRFLVRFEGPWHETTAGRHPRAAEVRRVAVGLARAAWPEPVRVTILAVRPLREHPGAAAFAAGGPFPDGS